MMRSLKLIGVCCALACGLSLGRQADAVVLFQDHFDTDVVGTTNPAIQTVDGDVGSISIRENSSGYLGVSDNTTPGDPLTAGGTNRYVFQIRGASTDMGRLQPYGWNVHGNEVQLDFDYWLEPDAATASLLTIWGLNIAPQTGGGFSITTASVYAALDNTLAAPGAWHHARIIADYTAQTFTTSINGGTPVSAYFYVSGIDHVRHFVFYQGSPNHTTYVDNVVITTPNLPPLAWNTDSSGNWNVLSNWATNDTVPNGIDAEATLGGAITANRWIYSETPITLGSLTFDNFNKYEIVGESLSMQVGAGSASIDVLQGAHKINLPLTIASPTAITVASGAALKISDPLTVSAALTVTGDVVYESYINVTASGSLTAASIVAPGLSIGVPAGGAQAVPEPGSLMLLALASALCAFRVWRSNLSRS